MAFYMDMSALTHDLLGQEIHDGDFVLSGQRDGNSGKMGMGVMKDAQKYTRVSIAKTAVGSFTGTITAANTWVAGQVAKIGQYHQAVKIPDEMLAKIDPLLFDKVCDIREALKYPTNRELKFQVNEKEELERILADKLKVKNNSH
jgi:hypothetical protein